MLKSIKKRLLIPLGIVATIGTVLIPHSKTINQKTNNNYWYSNLTNDKFQVREQSFVKDLSDNGEIINVPVDNNYQLKLLLNPGFESDNIDFIQQFNNDFINKVKNNKLKFISGNPSRIMPIIYFYFEKESDREYFTTKIKDWKEIFQIIIYKNENIKEWNWGNSSGFEYYRKTYSNLNNAPTKSINNFKQSVEENLSILKGDAGLTENKTTKIGILEAGNEKFDYKYSEFFKRGLKVNEESVIESQSPLEKHGIFVSMIAGSQFGVDRSATIYLSKFTNGTQWQDAIEKMVLDDGVKIINHSYGPQLYYIDSKTGQKYINPQYFEGYNENSYFLDYISRKYGVINVISSGNDGYNPIHQITQSKLSFNSIVVGALGEKANSKNIKKNETSYYTNYNLAPEYATLAKPLVVAPGTFYNMFYESWMKREYEFDEGTSYAAPLITGLVSNFLKRNPTIYASEFRVPIIKTILSASAVSPKFSNLTYKTSGFEQKYGAGTPDAIKMIEAANNYKTAKVNPTLNTGKDIITSNELWLRNGQSIKISSSWLFNAGILKNNEPRSNWWGSFLNFFSNSRKAHEEAKWKKTHNDELWLKDKETFERQGGNWFSDYNLILERKDSRGNWITVKGVYTKTSNDELIEYNVFNSGIYRYRINKVSSSTFGNSVDDIIAVTHVVRNEK